MQRTPKLDVAKGVLIFTVVLIHTLELGIGMRDPAAAPVVMIIQTVVMPAFIFLAGATAKRGRELARAAGFLALLAIFHAAYVLVHMVLLNEPYPERAWSPYFHLWFLMSLAVWVLLAPAIRAFPRAALPVAIAVALGAGFFDEISKPWSLSRTCVFLPFFVAGILYGWRVINWTTAKATPLLRAVSLVIVLGTGPALVAAGISHRWYFGAASYRELYAPGLEGFAARTVLMSLAVAVLVGFLILIPNRPSVLERVGRRSLAIYLFHAFGVIAIAGVVAAIADRYGSVAATVFSFAPALAITALLTLPIFDRSVRMVLDTVGRWVPARPREPQPS